MPALSRSLPLALLSLLFAAEAPGQVFVIPRHAEKSSVRHFTFDWRYVDILVELESGKEPRSGGVRLYFYEHERQVAERAVASIESSYRQLVERFRYVPTRTFPYILYSSYQEFLQTNLFPLQEGILGVTSPRDLKLSLPYLGDPRLFEEVGLHEMAHQFTIQKIRTVVDEKKALGDPLEVMPLWFIEGLAEYYAKRGIDPEAEMLVSDLLGNPGIAQG